MRGTNQSGLRAHNERMILSIVRLHGEMAKAEIARTIGLSAQTVSVIMRDLEAEGLLVKGEPVRGRVGQPSTPMRINADGAYFFGLKVGRRSVELVLVDFLGNIRDRAHHTHRFPTPEATLEFTKKAVTEITAKLSLAQVKSIFGLGISIPFQLWDWANVIGVAPEDMDSWRTADIRADLEQAFPFPVYLQNDATAACGAELVFGEKRPFSDFLYFYVGFFIGGGVVLNGSLFSGKTGNAGALGSMPAPTIKTTNQQLIDVASLVVLERLLVKAGQSSDTLWDQPAQWDIDQGILDQWIEQTAKAIAFAIVSATAVIDFEAAVIDGWLPDNVRARLVADVDRQLHKLNLAGLVNPPVILEGTVGPDARALGAASLPLSERFLTDQNTGINN
ncbi:MAG TPA: ROK family transcriptional regulator [Paracoccaceae bacterium]|nr:ROK family transcriptional regulator [Paracoccaceae bacterium]